MTSERSQTTCNQFLCVLSEDFIYIGFYSYPSNNRGANNKSVLFEDSSIYFLIHPPLYVSMHAILTHS